MTNIQPLSDLLNWKLLKGGYDFPGPDGGTCITEAAIVAAGFEYRSVSSWKDCPPCFSPLISQFAIDANERLPDEERQKLLPYVLRLAGSKGSVEIETQRAQWLTMSVIKQEAAEFFKNRDAELAAKCAAVKELSDCVGLEKPIRAIASAIGFAFAIANVNAKVHVIAAASADVIAFANAKRCIELLDGMLAIGPSGDIAPDAAAVRLRSIRQTVAA